MIKDPKRAKEHIIMRGVARSSRRRAQSGPYHPDPEEIAEILHRQRAERAKAVTDIRAEGNWLKISEIIDDVANAKGAQLNSEENNKVAMEVCERIVLDSAAGRLGSEQLPVLMLLSDENAETTLKPSWLARTISAYDGMSGTKKRQAIAELMKNHGWMERATAVRWLEGGGYSVPTLWKQAKHPNEPPPAPPKEKQGKRGRKLGYDWEEAKLFAEKMLNHNGDFAVPAYAREDLRSQADLEQLVGDHIEKLDKKRPADSTIRKHIVPTINAWRNKQIADN